MIKTNFLRYLGSCNAIPASWTETLICGVENCEMNLLPSPSDLGNWNVSMHVLSTFQKSFGILHQKHAL